MENYILLKVPRFNLARLLSLPPFKELVTLPTKSRDWKGILISILVILFVAGLVLLAIQLVKPKAGPPRYNKLLLYQLKLWDFFIIII